MNEDCVHLEDIRDVTPRALGCEECLKPLGIQAPVPPTTASERPEG
jgi:hypothetical protein